MDHAIDCYDRALALGEKDQEGILLVMRGTALLQRAYAMKIRIKDLLTSVSPLVPQLEEFLYRLLVLSQIVRSAHRQLLLVSGVSTPYYVLLCYVSSAKVALVYLSQLPRLSSWAEMKAKWPEAAEGPLLSADMPHLLDRMIFLSALHDNALWRALQDLLTATILIPTFPQV